MIIVVRTPIIIIVVVWWWIIIIIASIRAIIVTTVIIIPVSYTHLDVYKRQVLRRGKCYDSTEQSMRLSNAPERSRRKRVVYVLLNAFCENFLDCARLRSGDVYKRQIT